MKEIDKVNLFIHYLTVSSKFESQEEVGKHLGYPNKSSFSQMLKKEMTTVFRERFYEAFPEFENFYIGFIDSNTNNELIIQKEKDEAIKNLQERKIKVLTEKIDKFVKEIEEFKSLIKG